MNLRPFNSVQDRRVALEKEVHVALSETGTSMPDETLAASRHCENMIGATRIPLGVAGPLTVKRQKKKTSYYVPLATTEGALVASVNRGCKAIEESGGVHVRSKRAGTTRGPVFEVGNLEKASELVEFLDRQFVVLQKKAKETSGHIELLSYSVQPVGRYVYVRFVFDTQDAMGMNMVTIATQSLSAYITEKTHAVCLSLSGNYCVDKKPSLLNFIQGRGMQVWAEVTIPKKVLTHVLKTTAKNVSDVWLAKCLLGSVMSGSFGYNAQYANVVAAVFAATGQDIAHVGEGSLGVTTASAVGQDLYLSIYLPDLMVGTVGGGTGLATQKEALSLLGVYGGNKGANSLQLAEIIGAAVLAGELSLLSSLEQGSLVRAHQSLARGKK